MGVLLAVSPAIHLVFSPAADLPQATQGISSRYYTGGLNMNMCWNMSFEQCRDDEDFLRMPSCRCCLLNTTHIRQIEGQSLHITNGAKT